MPTGIELSAGIVVGAAKPIDAKFGPYATTAAALADIPAAIRYKGLTVGIEISGKVVEYWFRDGVADGDLVEKISASPGTTDASLLTSGILPDARLSTNITRRGGDTVVSDAAPATPFTGLRWVNSNTGRAFDWVDNFWVETGAGGGGGGNANVQYVTELPANPSPTTFYVVTPVGGTSTIYLGNISLAGGSGGGGGSTFTPTSIAGLQLWLDADDSTTLFDATSGGSAVSADGSVARWEDKSGNGTHVTQSTVNARPLLKTFQKNGRSGIYFDGNDFFAKPKQLFTTTVTIFAVAKFSNNNERLAILDLGSSTQNSYATIEQNTFNTSGGKYGFYWSSSSNDTNIPTDSFEKIFSVSVNSLYGTNIASSTLYRINGVSASITRTGGRIDHQDYTAVSGFVIGGFNTGQNGSPFSNGAELLKGTIYEILVYNSYLSNSDRQQVESYLSTKWGISI